MAHTAPTDFRKDNRQLGDTAAPLARYSLIIGSVVSALGLFLGFFRGDGGRYLMHAYLVDFVFLLSLTLGALFFVSLQHLVGASWSVSMRRLAEIVASNMPLMAILAIPIALSLLVGGGDSLYIWNNADLLKTNELLAKKHAYLNAPFFCIRLGLFFLIWSALSRYFVSRSIKQDTTGDPALSESMRSVSAPTMLVFAITVTFAAFDLLMSLTPFWYSTIFGVYYFAGCIVGFLAFLIILAVVLQNYGWLTNVITIEHYHDAGKLMFGFTIFWAYIAFSQYLLIWYANIPEETIWYHIRQTGNWVLISLLLLFGHFFIPFLGLISRSAKRNKPVLAFWAGWMLCMCWVDHLYIVMPSVSPEGAQFPLIEIMLLVGMGGIYLSRLAKTAGETSLLAEGDPKLSKSLAFENV